MNMNSNASDDELKMSENEEQIGEENTIKNKQEMSVSLRKCQK